MPIRQLFDPETSSYSYLLFDPDSGDAMLVDPVLEQVERDLELVRQLGLTLKFVAETHLHGDHVTSSARLRRRTGAKVAVPARSSVRHADLMLEHGDRLRLGRLKVQVLATPGHTDGCLSFLFEGAVLTGDSLLIRGCGRSDRQGGDAAALYRSITQVLFRLPDATVVLPGHDYSGKTCSTIGEEKQHNPLVGTGSCRASFERGVSESMLPRCFDGAIGKNRHCGAPEALAVNDGARRNVGWP